MHKFPHQESIVTITVVLIIIAVFSCTCFCVVYQGDVKASCVRVSLVCPVSQLFHLASTTHCQNVCKLLDKYLSFYFNIQ